ncbi:MAG TPA: hypothetical protein VGC97_18085 [Pyrinomonadaceae bacterium]|jgi:hypothetical protein
MSVKIQEPIVNGSLRATNFFNGRLVTGADMTREQAARREAVSRIGQAAGEGVVYGLEVEKDTLAGTQPIVGIKAGLAVNACGQALYLADDVSVNLLERETAPAQAKDIFGECGAITVGNYTSGYGLYLLVISPAQSTEGSAPTSGLNNVFSSCNTDVILETVQFRRLAMDTYLQGETPPAGKLLRNYIAYRCFGALKTRKFFADPLGTPLASYGLIDEMRDKTLAKSEVPLAVIHWTESGIKFVDNWAVRRRVTKKSPGGNWTQLLSDRRASETEAMMRQFEEQLKRIELEENNLTLIKAEDFFRFLPPAGILPLAVAGKPQKGFNAVNFFGTKGTKLIVNTDGDRLRPLLDNALNHEPIDLQADEKIWLYYVRENVKAIDNGAEVRKALVFARHSLPFIGVARFNEAQFDEDRFYEPII